MAINYILNGAPQTVAHGVDDKSKKRRVYQEAHRGIHIPMIYSYAPYGPVDEPMLVYGNTLPLTFGEDVLNGRSKFATHVTPYLLNFLSNANSVLFERVLPKDAGPKATLRIYMDVNETELDEYEREIDGSFKRDTNDDIVKTGAKIQGLEIRFTTEIIPIEPGTGRPGYGLGSTRTGDMTNHLGQPSVKMPFLDMIAPHIGEIGNNKGIRIWAPTLRDLTPMRDKLLEEDGCYPFRMSFVERVDALSSSQIIPTLYGEQFDDVVLKPDMVDTSYNRDRYLSEVALKQYQDIAGVNGGVLRYGPVGGIHIYQTNLESILKKILSYEKSRSYADNDLQGRDETDEDHKHYYRVNLLGLQNPSGAPYQTARFDTTNSSAIRFSENTDLFMGGSSDGTMSEAELAKVVEQKLDLWGDPDSPYQDIISYPCSYFWDSGFPLSTKYKMGKFIAQRKNTNVAIGTYIAGESPLTASEETSRHIAIVERVRAYAESDFFNTPAMRACVVSRSGVPHSSTYRGRLPCTYELSNMVSRLASGTTFDKSKLFDRRPYNIFELMGDVSSLWVPQRVRNKDWANGMMWPEKLNTRQVYFPAARTVYKDDTSVLTSVIGAIILAECQTIGILAQKYFSGGLYSRYILKANLESWLRDRLEGKFGTLVRIQPTVLFTDLDNQRGYSWTLVLKVGLPMMDTVQTLYIEAYDINESFDGDGSRSFVS